jgi:hypothetical protein
MPELGGNDAVTKRDQGISRANRALKPLNGEIRCEIETTIDPPRAATLSVADNIQQ